MKSRYMAAVLCMLIAALTSAQAQRSVQGDEIIVYRLPDPERVYIYRTGSVVYDAAIAGNAIVNNTFILPDNVNMESLIISQAGKRIYSYTTYTAEALVMLRSGERPNLVKVMHVYSPDIKPGQPLELKYGIRESGLSWNLLLDMEVLDGNNMNCALIAEIRANANIPETTKSILSKSPEIILASASNVLLEDSSSFFNLGRLLVEANKRMLVTLEQGTTKYSIVYQWDANRRERPYAYLRAATPLKAMAANVRYYLNSAGLNIDYDSIAISPDRPFNLHIGEQPTIVTHKSIVTAEFPARENIPFTHNLEYTVENQSVKSIALEISVPVTYGEKHRTEYHFTKAPDERPGDNMIWKYNLAPGEKTTLQFSYDTDIKYDPSYRQFDYSDGGR